MNKKALIINGHPFYPVVAKGTLTRSYMPKKALDDPNEYLFEGKGLDDLLLPIHANFRYIGMQKLPTFASFDVLKNPNLAQDLKAFEAHLNKFVE